MKPRDTVPPRAPQGVWQIGRARVDFERRTIDGGAGPVPVEPKVLDVLCCLMENAGATVDRETLIARVWGVRYGGQERLARAVSLLRKALGDVRGGPGHISTVPRQGYRLDATARALIPVPAAATITEAGPGLIGDEATLAVLPLAVPADETELAALAEGLSEDLLNRLARVPGLWVTGQASSRLAAAAGGDPVQTGRALTVRHVLHGTLACDPGGMELELSLLRVSDGATLWSDRVRAPATETLGRIDSLARAVLHTILGGHGRAAISGADTPDPEAYLWFTLGRSLVHRLNGQTTIPTGIDYLGRALALDPDFAEARAWRALGRYILPEFALAPDWRAHRAAAADDAARAIAQEPDCGMAHLAQGMIHSGALRLDDALQSMERAHTLDPGNVETMAGHALMLMAAGYPDRARPLIERVVARDPLCSAWHITLGGLDLVQGRAEAAQDRFRTGFDLGFGAGAFGVAQALALQGRGAEAAAFLQRNLAGIGPVEARQLANPLARRLALAAAYGGGALARRALILALRVAESLRAPQPTASTASLRVLVGDATGLARALRRAPPAYMAFTLALCWSPQAAPLRAHPAMVALFEKLGLPAIRARLGPSPLD